MCMSSPSPPPPPPPPPPPRTIGEKAGGQRAPQRVKQDKRSLKAEDRDDRDSSIDEDDSPTLGVG